MNKYLESDFDGKTREFYMYEDIIRVLPKEDVTLEGDKITVKLDAKTFEQLKRLQEAVYKERDVKEKIYKTVLKAAVSGSDALGSAMREKKGCWLQTELEKLRADLMVLKMVCRIDEEYAIRESINYLNARLSCF